MPVSDPYRLQRFVDAQDPVYEKVVQELSAGAKRSHWMWFIFPQIRGLGETAMSWEYGISSLEEASAYLQHPVLGERLRECTRLVLEANARSLAQILGFPDDLKFRSSMTLFAQATDDNALFLEALEKYSHGEQDPLTLEIIEAQKPA